MQWAGIPDSVYSDSRGKNDYTDDYKSRGIWVNYLAGGSAANPTEKRTEYSHRHGFRLPFRCRHHHGDTIIGTLGIFKPLPMTGYMQMALHGMPPGTCAT